MRHLLPFALAVLAVCSCSNKIDTPDKPTKKGFVPNLVIHPTFNSVGIVSDTLGFGDSFQYREKGSSDWISVNDFRGSLGGLKEDTIYEIKVTYSGTELEKSFKTWKSDVKVLRTIKIPSTIDGTYTISEKGSENAWVKYTADKGTVTNTSSSTSIRVDGASYVVIDDMILKGAKDSRYVIEITNSDHIRIRNCDISGWGTSVYTQDFKADKYGAYLRPSGSTLNYESAIRIMEGSSCVVVERCYVHDPIPTSVSWYYRHPLGPEAVYMCRPDHSTVLRWNDFVGSDLHRWNDAVEGYGNFYYDGGFNRDAEIYGNFMIFANDDCIEIDGGQRNIRVYQNRFEGSLTSTSVQGCMVGPSYVYDNLVSGLGEQFNKYGETIKTDTKNGENAYCLISNNILWGSGSKIKERPGIYNKDNQYVTYAEANLPVEYPARPLPFTLSRARISVDQSRSDVTVQIIGELPAGSYIAKPEAMDWLLPELQGNSVVIRFDDTKMHDRHFFRGAFLVRTPDGLSRPLSVYATSDYVPPLIPDVGSKTAIYATGFTLNKGATKSVTYNVPKDDTYWLFIHGYTGGSQQKLQVSLDGVSLGEARGQQFNYPTWCMVSPGCVSGSNMVYPFTLKKGDHTFTLTHSSGSYQFDGLVLTNSPASFEPR